MQVFLDVIEAEDFLDSPILELDLVVYFAPRLLLLLNRMCNDLNSRLLLRLLQLIKIGRLLLRFGSITKGSAARRIRTLRLGLGTHHVLLNTLL